MYTMNNYNAALMDKTGIYSYLSIQQNNILEMLQKCIIVVVKGRDRKFTEGG